MDKQVRTRDAPESESVRIGQKIRPRAHDVNICPVPIVIAEPFGTAHWHQIAWLPPASTALPVARTQMHACSAVHWNIHRYVGVCPEGTSFRE
jgi:hypothetical protein